MLRLRSAAALSAVLFVLAPLRTGAVELSPVVTTGLSSPLFVGHAGDGSNRLFILEQVGDVKVLQPGSSTPTVFLDIQTRIVAGREKVLPGRAVHPAHAANRRFFVD